MNAICLRCQRRERAPGLLVCTACVEGLVAPKAKDPTFVPEWRRRSLAKDFTGRAA